MANDNSHDRPRAFERTSKRRKGFPSETRLKRGLRVVHGRQGAHREARAQRPVPLRIAPALSRSAA
jgi:hypothetical protein